jgi:hypothetical protein
MVLLMSFAALVVVVQDQAGAANPATPVGLVRVSSNDFDSLYVRPGVDLRAYSKVIIEPASVEFRGDWLRDMNNARDTSRRLASKDAQEIADDARSWIADALTETFAASGYQVVSVAGPNTLRVSPGIIGLYVNAPDKASPGRWTILTNDAGAATLALEARDAVTNVPIIALSDRRTAARVGGLAPASDMSNRSDFLRMFSQWAAGFVTEIRKPTLPATR